MLAHLGDDGVVLTQQAGSSASKVYSVLGCRGTSDFKECVCRAEQLPVCLFCAVASDWWEMIPVLNASDWNFYIFKGTICFYFFSCFQLIALLKQQGLASWLLMYSSCRISFLPDLGYNVTHFSHLWKEAVAPFKIRRTGSVCWNLVVF